MREITKRIESFSFHHEAVKNKIIDLIIVLILLGILAIIFYTSLKISELLILSFFVISGFSILGIFNYLMKKSLNEEGFDIEWNLFRHWHNKVYYNRRIDALNTELLKIGVSTSILDNLINYFLMKSSARKNIFALTTVLAVLSISLNSTILKRLGFNACFMIFFLVITSLIIIQMLYDNRVYNNKIIAERLFDVKINRDRSA